MTGKIKPLLGLASLALAVPAFAQRPTAPARPASAVHSSATRIQTVRRPPVIRMPVRPAASRTMVRVGRAQANTGVVNGTLTSSPVIFVPAGTNFGQFINGVPGLGFDFSHVAALNQNFAEKAFIDPATQEQISLAERLAPLSQPSIVGFPLFGGASEPVVLASQQPPVIVVEQPQQPAQSQPAQQEEAQPAPQVQQPPLPDIGEFVLILRNGMRIQAAAFTRQNSRIIYVTKEGKRKSFAAADLDVTATKNANNERGTPLQL